MMLAGFIAGFLVGARSRQIVAKLKVVGKAVLSLQMLLKIKEAAAGLEDAEAMAEGDDDDDEGDGKKEEEHPLDDFLNVDSSEGLDDHHELELSPVMMYQIKKAKDEERKEKLRANLIAEGMTAEEADERLMLASEMGGNIGDGKPNALSVLIAAGARVEAVKGATSEDMQKKIEMRRKQRNVAVFLQRKYEIEIKAPALKDGGDGVRLKGNQKTAYDVARETKLQPFGGKGYARELRRIEQAKSARKVWRVWKVKYEAQRKRKRIASGGRATEVEAEPEPPEKEADEDIGNDEGEEGEEGEEGFGEEDGDAWDDDPDDPDDADPDEGPKKDLFA